MSTIRFDINVSSKPRSNVRHWRQGNPFGEHFAITANMTNHVVAHKILQNCSESITVIHVSDTEFKTYLFAGIVALLQSYSHFQTKCRLSSAVRGQQGLMFPH